MVESTIDVNFYKRALLEELIGEVTVLMANNKDTTWSEISAYLKVKHLLENKLEKFKENDNE